MLKNYSKQSWVILLVMLCNIHTATAQRVLLKGSDSSIGLEAAVKINSSFNFRVAGFERIIKHSKNKQGFITELSIDNKSSMMFVDYHIAQSHFRATMGVFVEPDAINFQSESFDVNKELDDIVIPAADIVRLKHRIVGLQEKARDLSGAEISLAGLLPSIVATAAQQNIDLQNIVSESASQTVVLPTFDTSSTALPDDESIEDVVIELPSLQLALGDIFAKGSVEFTPVAPYFGLGFGNPPDSDSRWGYSVDIGVIYHGEPQIDVHVDGGLRNIHPLLTQAIDQWVAEEHRALQEKLSDKRLRPYLSMGVSVAF